MVRKVLLDSDIICYEVAFAANTYWKKLHEERGEDVTVSPPWEIVADMLDTRIPEIVDGAGGEGEPILFFTGKNNFREQLAVTFDYKALRPAKPFHYANIKAYLQSKYKFYEEDGLEADDLLGIFLTAHPDLYICASRDKDLKQIPGWHYGWEVNKQASFGPELIDEIGYLTLSDDPKNRKLLGTGSKFLHVQMLMGDRTDTIPGLPNMGKVKAFKLINPCSTINEMEQVVLSEYKKVFGDEAEERMIEMGRMVYMIRWRQGDHIKLYTPSWHPTTLYDLRTKEIVVGT